jgi:nucleoside-diphosphate-sugar epimerase
MPDTFAGRPVVVTGGLGFIGSNLVRRLVALGAEVTVIDSLAAECGGRRTNLAGVEHRVRLALFDLAYAASRAHLFENCDLVFSLASATGHLSSMQRPLADLHHNCVGHLAMLETLRRSSPGASIVVGGTRQVYGRIRRLPVDERHPVRPTDVNGIHLRAVEEYYRLYHEAYGLASTVLRLTNVYGPGMNVLPGTPHGFAAVCLGRALRGETINLFDGGTARRDFLHVDDVVNGLLAAAVLPMDRHEIYNLGHERPYRLRDFAEGLARRLPANIQEVPFPADARRIDIGDYYTDFGKFRRAARWSPKLDLDAGLEATVAHYRASPQEYELSSRNDPVPSIVDVDESPAAPRMPSPSLSSPVSLRGPAGRASAAVDGTLATTRSL